MVLNKLLSFGSPCFILGGDLNVTLSPAVDTSSSKSTIPHSTLTHIKSLFHSAQLVDVWQVQHLFERDYSCYLVAHNSYSRINYFLVSQSLLDVPLQASLGNILWFDHTPAH